MKAARLHEYGKAPPIGSSYTTRRKLVQELQIEKPQ